MNRTEAEKFIKDEFGAEGEHLWLSYPDFAVFRNAGNRKWFAVIMNIEKSKLGLESNDKVDIINLKCDPVFIGSLRNNEGYFPAYHMNKSYWISVLLDGTVRDEEIKDLIHLSYELIDSSKK